MRYFALTTKQGTAMSETALTEEEMENEAFVATAISNAAADPEWDGSETFTDCTENEVIAERFQQDYEVTLTAVLTATSEDEAREAFAVWTRSTGYAFDGATVTKI